MTTPTPLDESTFARLAEAIRWDSSGLVAALVVDHAQGDMLMMAWMNRDSLLRTLQLGQMVFWSRSRNEIWHKGATSGNAFAVVDWRLDCDGDALLFRVQPLGLAAACHTGRRSCFFRRWDSTNHTWIDEGTPLFDPAVVYVGNKSH